MTPTPPIPGQPYRQWIASGFTRRCVVVRVDERDRMALVTFPEYDLPDEWVKWDNLS